MNEREANRMQCLTRESWRRGARTAPTVGDIADQRMVDRRKVNTDLMRASRFERARDECRNAESFQRRNVRARGLSTRHDGHRGACVRMTTDRRIDDHGARDIAMHERDVLAFHRPRLQLAHEIGLRNRRLRDDQ
jgi:hypothetical protein